MRRADTSEAEGPRRREKGGIAFRIGGWTSLLAAIGIAVVYVTLPRDLPEVLNNTRLVIGNMVVDWWGIEGALVLVGIASVIVGRSLSPRPSGRRRVRLTIGTVVLVVAALSGAAWVGVGEVFTDYRVLEENSESGCRIVIREGISGGEAGIIQPGSFIIDWTTAFYGADDFYRPVASGTYSLRWVGETAKMTIWGEPGRPASWYDEPELQCR